jgi:hypothetical protein
MPDIQYTIVGVFLCFAVLCIWYTIYELCDCKGLFDCDNTYVIKRVKRNKVHPGTVQSDTP